MTRTPRPASRKIHRILAILLAGAVAAGAGVAIAEWLGGGDGSGFDQGQILPTGNTPSASAVGPAVTVTWSQNTFDAAYLGTFSGGGYEIERYSTSALTTPITPGGTCAGVVSGTTASLSCTEDVMAGDWVYTVTPALENWRGTESAQSATVTVVPPPAPVIDTFPANPTSSTTATFTFHDSQAGVTFECQIDGGGFSACVSGVSYPVAQGSHTLDVRAVDAADNRSGSTSYTWLVDTTGPSSAITFPVAGTPYNAAGWNAGCGTPTTGDFCGTATDNAGGSGVSTVAVAVEQGTGNYWDPAANGGLGGFTGATQLFFPADDTTWSAVFAAANFTPDGSYTVYAKATDAAANTGPTVSTTFVIDTALPTVPSSVIVASPSGTAGFIRAGGSYVVYANAADTGGSGVATVTADTHNIESGAFTVPLPVCTSACTVGTTTYGYKSAVRTAGSGLSAGNKLYTVTATDNAGNTLVKGGFTVTVDNAAPTATSVIASTQTSQAGSLNAGGQYLIYANLSDTAGAASATANVNTITAGSTAVPLAACSTGCTIGATTYGFKSAPLVADAGLTAGSKSYTLTTTDVIGNSGVQTGFSVTIDNTAPTLSTLQMFDNDHNGKVDTVVATFSENVFCPPPCTAPWTLTAVPSGGSLNTVTTTTTQATLSLTEGAGAADTSVGSFVVTLATGSLSDAAGNFASFTNQAPADKANPVVVGLASQQSGGGAGNGLVENGDKLLVTFSESIAPSSVVCSTGSEDRSGTGNVTLTIAGVTNGALDTGSTAYISPSTGTRHVTFNASCGVSGAVVTVTVSSVATSPAGTTAAASSGALAFKPNAAIKDGAANGAAGTFTTASTFKLF